MNEENNASLNGKKIRKNSNKIFDLPNLKSGFSNHQNRSKKRKLPTSEKNGDSGDDSPTDDSPPTNGSNNSNLVNDKMIKMLKKNYVLTDITHLLVYPQKVAAAILGVKVAILNKRFKEATNRKWPFRYLSKIENEIESSATEEEKVELLKKREQLLSPISIVLKKKK